MLTCLHQCLRRMTLLMLVCLRLLLRRHLRHRHLQDRLVPLLLIVLGAVHGLVNQLHLFGNRRKMVETIHLSEAAALVVVTLMVTLVLVHVRVSILSGNRRMTMIPQLLARLLQHGHLVIAH